MASDTLPVFQSQQLTRELSHNYSQLVIEHINFVAKVYCAISYFNMGEAEKAQETLQVLISQYERSH